jgi:hypothetical protein
MPVSKYEKFARQFNLVKFDARQWLFINDMINKRILSVKLGYQIEAEAGITK